MEIKKFHLKDFPTDRIRVLFKNNEKFLGESINYFGSIKKLADFLSISPYAISSWKKLNLFIPLQHIKKIVNERNLDWNKIEKNVNANIVDIKTKNGKYRIYGGMKNDVHVCKHVIA